MPTTYHYDVAIIGSGAAGLALALSLADYANVAIFSKEKLIAGSSQYAQGGISAVLGRDDSIESHINDTCIAGAGLCDRDVVKFIVERAPAAIQWLGEQGVPFVRDTSDYSLRLEGGHSHRRVVHAADRTGAVMVGTLSDAALAHPNIHCFTQTDAVDLLMHDNICQGISVFNHDQQQLCQVQAQAVVLATGGASSIYCHTTHPSMSSGDGIAMAWRAGARIMDMEFNQFHPTCLYHPHIRSFLISEAVRGEGGRLVLPNGERFMPAHDQREELAPRDIVARAIDAEMKKHNLPCVYLDITHLPAATIKQKFPMIYQRCWQGGLDITTQPIPVVPASHYTCGGVKADVYGQTDIPGLYAIGEVAYTGLHGANRMASNSLMECIVLAASSAQKLRAELKTKQTPLTLENVDVPVLDIPSDPLFAAIPEHIQTLRNNMWQWVSIVRDNRRLNLAYDYINALRDTLRPLAAARYHHPDFLTLYNLADVANLVVRSARARHESRGLHYSLDYPDLAPVAQHTIEKKDKNIYN